MVTHMDRIKKLNELLNALLVAAAVPVCLVSLYLKDVHGLLAGIFLLLVAIWAKLYTKT